MSLLFTDCWSTAMRPGLVSIDLVKLSILVRLAPRKSGDRAMHHKVNIVLCSSSGSLVVLGAPSPGAGDSSPIGSISASGQLPGLAYFSQLAARANWAFMPCELSLPLSQWSHT